MFSTNLIIEINFCQPSKHSIENMEHLDKKSLLDLPDEAIELIMDYLSFKDLSNLGIIRDRLGNCAKRVAKKKTFSKYYRIMYLT